jgi:hypothetical protein
LASNIRSCRREAVSLDGGTDRGAASLNAAATISLGDSPISALASAVMAGNAARKPASTAVTSEMALNAPATLAFGVAMSGSDSAKKCIAESETAVSAPAKQPACQIFKVASRVAAVSPFQRRLHTLDMAG